MAVTKLTVAQKVRGESLKLTIVLSEDVSAATEIWFIVKSAVSDADAAAIHNVTKTGGGIVVSGTQVVVSVGNFCGSLSNRATAVAAELRVMQSDGFVGVAGQCFIQLKAAVYKGA